MSDSRRLPAPSGPPLETQVMVIGSGAGGALIVSNWDEEISDALRDDDSGLSEFGHWVGRPSLSAAAIGTMLVDIPNTPPSASTAIPARAAPPETPST